MTLIHPLHQREENEVLTGYQAMAHPDNLLRAELNEGAFAGTSYSHHRNPDVLYSKDDPFNLCQCLLI